MPLMKNFSRYRNPRPSSLLKLAVLGASALVSPLTAASPGPFAGRWAMRQITTTVAEVPVIGKVFATTTSVSLHKLKHKGERLRGRGRICRVALDSGSALVKTVMPRALLEVLPAPRIDAKLRDEGGHWSFSQARQTIVLGAKLDNPLTDPLPRLPGDAHVFDQDGDGYPAVTIRVSGIVSGDIRVVQRSWTELVGERVTHDRIDGSIRFGNEQVILDATSSMLKSPPPAVPELSRSRFTLVRLPDGATCGDALRATGD